MPSEAQEPSAALVAPVLLVAPALWAVLDWVQAHLLALVLLLAVSDEALEQVVAEA